MGKVVYLTVEESQVEAGKSQRRPGMHIDAPRLRLREAECPAVFVNYGWGGRPYQAIPGRFGGVRNPIGGLKKAYFNWGAGRWEDRNWPKGGIYSANTVKNSG